MHTTDLSLLFDYNHWANQRVLAAAAHANPIDFIAPAGLSHGSLRGALVHVYAAEHVWRRRCQDGVSPAALPVDTDFPTLADLTAAWDAESAQWQTFIAGLDDNRLNATVTYTNTKGQSFETALVPILLHVANHGTQFRAEAAVRLTQLGHSPGDLDLIAFVRT